MYMIMLLLYGESDTTSKWYTQSICITPGIRHSKTDGKYRPLAFNLFGIYMMLGLTCLDYHLISNILTRVFTCQLSSCLGASARRPLFVIRLRGKQPDACIVESTHWRDRHTMGSVLRWFCVRWTRGGAEQEEASR